MNNSILKHKQIYSTPVPEGYPLTDTQIDDVARVMFSRFYQQDGGPDYKNLFSENIRNGLINLVKQTVDCLEIKGYLVIPPKIDV